MPYSGTRKRTFAKHFVDFDENNDTPVVARLKVFANFASTNVMAATSV